MYPEHFVSRVKQVLSDDQLLMTALDSGDYRVGGLLERAANRLSPTPRQILLLLSIAAFDMLITKANHALRVIKLYEEWKNTYDNPLRDGHPAAQIARDKRHGTKKKVT